MVLYCHPIIPRSDTDFLTVLPISNRCILHGFPSHHTEAIPIWGLLVMLSRSGTPAANNIAYHTPLSVSSPRSWAKNGGYLSPGKVMPVGNSSRMPIQRQLAILVPRIVGETGEVNILDFTQGAGYCRLGGVHSGTISIQFSLFDNKQKQKDNCQKSPGNKRATMRCKSDSISLHTNPRTSLRCGEEIIAIYRPCDWRKSFLPIRVCSGLPS